jgi:ribose 5-phosphate isomerase A
MQSQSEETNWISKPFQQAAKNLAKSVVEQFVRGHLVIGLGSGPMAAAIVREMADFEGKETLECVPTSYQIKLEAECSGLRLVDEDKIPKLDIVFDGADEIDSRFNLIKGGGGALLREKIVHIAARQIVIAAESNKFVPKFTWPVPIEIHPFAIHITRKKLESVGGSAKMRMLKEGYPYVTENGNFVLDTLFDLPPQDIKNLEMELKSIPGVAEVGLFTERSGTTYFKAKEDGTFETIKNP